MVVNDAAYDGSPLASPMQQRRSRPRRVRRQRSAARNHPHYTPRRRERRIAPHAAPRAETENHFR